MKCSVTEKERGRTGLLDDDDVGLCELMCMCSNLLTYFRHRGREKRHDLL